MKALSQAAWLRRLIAFLRGKFWTQCPRCKQHFGGHEAHAHQASFPECHYRYVCGRCAFERGLNGPVN